MKLRMTSFDQPKQVAMAMVLPNRATAEATMEATRDEDQGCVLTWPWTWPLPEVLRLPRFWKAVMGQRYAEKLRIPTSSFKLRYARYIYA